MHGKRSVRVVREVRFRSEGNLVSYLPNGAIVLPAGEGLPIPGDGLLIPDLLGKVTADQGSGSIAVMEGTAEPGFGPPLHIHHSSEELFYVLQGQMDFQIGGQRVSATPGTLVMVPRGTAHAPRVVGRERARFLVMFAPAARTGCSTRSPHSLRKTAESSMTMTCASRCLRSSTTPSMSDLRCSRSTRAPHPQNQRARDVGSCGVIVR